MNKTRYFLFFALISFFVVSASLAKDLPTEPNPAPLCVTVESLSGVNIRDKATLAGEVVYVLYRPEQVQVITKLRSGWLLVRYAPQNKTGYIYTDFTVSVGCDSESAVNQKPIG